MRTMIKFGLIFFAALSAIGFSFSAPIHLLVSMGKVLPLPVIFWPMMLGVIVTFIPATIASQSSTRQFKAKDQWEASCRGCPKWMQSVVNIAGGYAMATFGVSMIWLEPAFGSRSSGGDIPPEFMWMASAYAVAFYFASFALLYSAAHAKGMFRMCLNGHNMYPLAKFCEECGAPFRVEEENNVP